MHGMVTDIYSMFDPLTLPWSVWIWLVNLGQTSAHYSLLVADGADGPMGHRNPKRGILVATSQTHPAQLRSPKIRQVRRINLWTGLPVARADGVETTFARQPWVFWDRCSGMLWATGAEQKDKFCRRPIQDRAHPRTICLVLDTEPEQVYICLYNNRFVPAVDLRDIGYFNFELHSHQDYLHRFNDEQATATRRLMCIYLPIFGRIAPLKSPGSHLHVRQPVDSWRERLEGLAWGSAFQALLRTWMTFDML